MKEEEPALKNPAKFLGLGEEGWAEGGCNYFSGIHNNGRWCSRMNLPRLTYCRCVLI